MNGKYRGIFVRRYYFFERIVCVLIFLVLVVWYWVDGNVGFVLIFFVLVLWFGMGCDLVVILIMSVWVLINLWMR